MKKYICFLTAIVVICSSFNFAFGQENTEGVEIMCDGACDAINVVLEKKGETNERFSPELLQRLMLDRSALGTTISLKGNGIDHTMHMVEYLIPSVAGFEKTGVKINGIKRIKIENKGETKQAIDELGGVLISYCNTGEYIKGEKNTYFSEKTEKDINRYAVITGYDDGFKADNFKTKPEGDGAWIIKDEAFDGGYAYISYYDASIYKEVLAINCEKIDDSNMEIYQYDGGYAYNNDASAFHIGHMCSAFVSNGDELLEEVSFFVNTNQRVDYEVGVYLYQTHPKDPTPYLVQMETDNTEETEPMIVTGTVYNSGYCTVKLPQRVPLAKNERFTVSVKLKTYGDVYLPIDTDEIITDAKGDPVAEIKKTSASMESYIKEDGNAWNEISLVGNKNTRVKALVIKAPVPQGYGKLIAAIIFSAVIYGGGYFVYLKHKRTSKQK